MKHKPTLVLLASFTWCVAWFVFDLGHGYAFWAGVQAMAAVVIAVHYVFALKMQAETKAFRAAMERKATMNAWVGSVMAWAQAAISSGTDRREVMRMVEQTLKDAGIDEVVIWEDPNLED